VRELKPFCCAVCELCERARDVYCFCLLPLPLPLPLPLMRCLLILSLLLLLRELAKASERSAKIFSQQVGERDSTTWIKLPLLLLMMLLMMLLLLLLLAKRIISPTIATTTTTTTTSSVLTIHIVRLPLGFVPQNFVGLGNPLELLLGVIPALRRNFVRVAPESRAAVRLLYFGLGGGLLHAESRVEGRGGGGGGLDKECGSPKK